MCAVEINAGGGDRADLEVTGVAGVNLAVEAPLQRPGGEMAADLIDRRQPALICQPPPLPWSSFAPSPVITMFSALLHCVASGKGAMAGI